MSTYFFNLCEKNAIVYDDEGSFDGCLSGARDAAVQAARGLIASDVMIGRVDLRNRIEICDESRAVVDIVWFKDVVVVAAE